MRLSETSDVWWKTAVIYCLDVQTFQDWNDDGMGDFVGLTERLDYLAELGVTCLWLMPFYPTPNLDDGYDISDYFGVDPRLGNLGDFVEFVRTAHDRGLRVIIDLVANHTSDQHPWFQAARSDPKSRYRDYYVWRKRKPPEPPGSVAFPGEETSIWQYDRRAGAYYLHHFYRFQPDLNIANADLRDEIAKMMGFWLHQGISGFRVDAVPAFIEVENPSEATGFDPQDYLRQLRAFMGRRNAEAMWIGEANVDPASERQFLGAGKGDELNMLFNFIVMQATYLSLARGSAEPLEEAMRALPQIPADTQWANFLRIHDELTLDKLTISQRDEVFAAFGPEPRMQLYGHGLRRRIAPMVDGDQKRLRMLFSLTFSLPGTPVLFYGDEIGMGENLSLHDRLSVRTPMQWTPEPNAGFTTGTPWIRVNPDYRTVNVAAAERDTGSVLHYVRRMILLRKSEPVLVYGRYQLLDRENPEVFAYTRNLNGRTVMVALSFSPAGGRTALPAGYAAGKLLMNNLATSPVQGSQLVLGPYQAVVLDLRKG